MISFITIAFAVVKLKIFKVLRTKSASMEGPFLRGSRDLTSQYMVQLC